MNNKDNEQKAISLFPKNCNLLLFVNKREQALFRYLGEDAEKVYVVELGTSCDGVLKLHQGPKTKKYRCEWAIDEARDLRRRERISRVDERGIPRQMATYAPDEAQALALEDRRALVGRIQRIYGDRPFLRRAAYTEAIADAANFYQVATKTAIKYYERFLFYGGHEFALVDQDWDKGAPGEERHGARDASGKLIESGRKTFAQRTNSLSKFARRLFPENLRARVKTFVRRNAHAPGASAIKLTRRFLETLCGFNRDEDGQTQSFPWDPRKLPSESNTLKIVTKLFKEERGRLAAIRASEAGVGYSAQIANGDLNIMDIDGTVVDCMLRYGNTRIEIDGVLKPTALLGIDRASRAIVGWCVTYRHENADCYVATIYSACTDKEPELERWGVAHLDGMVFGSPSGIFVDRGSGISEKVQKAVVEGLRKRLLMAAPGSPESKGDVEQFVGFFQDEIANLPGMTHGEPVRGNGKEKDAARRRNRQKLLAAPTDAQLTIAQFMKAFLTAISRYNLTSDVRRLRTALMLEADVPPVPKEIFLFNQALKDGDAAWMLTEEQIFRRLAKPFPSSTVAPGGIVSLSNREFTSDDLQVAAAAYEAIHRKPMPVKGFELFTSELSAIWDDDGHLEPLVATELSARRFGQGFPDIFDYVAMRGVADLDVKQDKHRKHETAEQAGRKGLVSQSTQRKMEAAEGTKRTVNSRPVRKAAINETGAEDTSALISTLQKARSAERKSRQEAAAPSEVVYAESTLTGNYQNVDIDF